MIKISSRAYQAVVKRDRYSFPVNSKPILNIATQNSQATRPKVVGSMKDQFTAFLTTGKRSVDEWETYYLQTCNGRAKIQAATDLLYNYLNKMPVDHSVFTRDLAEKYITELTINKTHYGMSGEYHSVLAAAAYFDSGFRFSTAEEESHGIDAWINDRPVQVKPHDSVKMHHVRNHADTDRTLVITYEAKKDCCYIHNPEFMD